MIIDNIKNCEKYESVHEGFKAGFLAIKQYVKDNAEIGKYEIDGKKVYAMVQEYESKLSAERKFEAHKNYIDIQFISEGTEVIYASDISSLTVKEEYNAEKDIRNPIEEKLNQEGTRITNYVEFYSDDGELIQVATDWETGELWQVLFKDYSYWFD